MTLAELVPHATVTVVGLGLDGEPPELAPLHVPGRRSAAVIAAIRIMVNL